MGMTQIVDLMLDDKHYKVVFPDDASPRAYLMTRKGPYTLLRGGSKWRHELYDRVVKAARRTLTGPDDLWVPPVGHP